jgi:hypothetical protein
LDLVDLFDARDFRLIELLCFARVSQVEKENVEETGAGEGRTRKYLS